MQAYLKEPTWYVVDGVVGLIALLIVLCSFAEFLGSSWAVAPRGRRRTASNLEEHLAEYPPPRPGTGDRQCGSKVCRAVCVCGPRSGRHRQRDRRGRNPGDLDKLVTGLGDIFQGDKPRVRIWPVQISYKGFATHFHRNTIIPEEAGEPTPWIVVAGRVKLNKQQLMLGMAMVAVKPTTVGRRTYDSHEWSTAVKVRASRDRYCDRQAVEASKPWPWLPKRCLPGRPYHAFIFPSDQPMPADFFLLEQNDEVFLNPSILVHVQLLMQVDGGVVKEISAINSGEPFRYFLPHELPPYSSRMAR